MNQELFVSVWNNLYKWNDNNKSLFHYGIDISKYDAVLYKSIILFLVLLSKSFSTCSRSLIDSVMLPVNVNVGTANKSMLELLIFPNSSFALVYVSFKFFFALTKFFKFL